jgi:uncharacterized protein (TIGR00369 family)
VSVVDSTRTRTITWSDPLALLEGARDRSGLEYLQAILNGELPPPPIAVLMGMTLVSLEQGRAVFAAEPGEFHYNPIGVVHGGLAMTLLDSAMGCAVHTTLPVGVAYTTLEGKVNFVRPITAKTGRILADGKVIHRGETIATAEGRVVAEATGKLLAHGTTTCLILGVARGAERV